MATIKSGASTDQLTIDPTSKAARVTLYDAQGNLMAPRSDNDRGILNVLVRQSAATGAGAAVWALRNATAGKVLYITRIWWMLAFDGTAAATFMRYEWIKGTGCTAMTGGVAVTPLLKRTSVTNPDVDARVLDTGLTQTGITQGAAFFTCTFPRWLPAAALSTSDAGPVSPFFEMVFPDSAPIELAQNEVLSLRNGPTNASVVGDTVLGGVDFIGG